VKCTVEEIFSLLEELKLTLDEEKRLLKKMDRTGLMALLPRKLFLINQLEQASRDSKLNTSLVNENAELKKTLSEIKNLNDTNRLFVEESLSLWNDFLSVLLPKQYRQDGSTDTVPVPYRGVTLRMEA
jgi:flagellar biosynthesis/type III secretory pathway chaperone